MSASDLQPYELMQKTVDFLERESVAYCITEEFFKEPKDLPPGEILDVADTIVLPKDIPAGEYALSVGVVGVEKTQPVVQLGIEGRDDDGWHPVSKIQVDAIEVLSGR